VFGAIIEKLAPHTEADPVAILAQLLVACGSAIGPGAYFQVEATRHHPAEFMLLAGDTAKSRKGSSLDHVTRLMGDADPDFRRRVCTGLSSGDYLTHPVICSRLGFPCSGRGSWSFHFG
jgi:hypothetical protein